MNNETKDLAIITSPAPRGALLMPALITEAGPDAEERFFEFFTAEIRNPNTRRAYARAVRDFLRWCEVHHLKSLKEIRPVLVAAYIETLTKEKEAQTVKQSLAAIRMLFNWLVIGQVVPSNPATAVRSPKLQHQERQDSGAVGPGHAHIAEQH